MSKRIFSDWKSLETYLKKEIDDVLKNEMAEHIKDEIQTGIKEVVYSPREPKKYERRYYSGGGLGDKSTMRHSVSNGEIEVTPNAERNIAFSKYPGLGYNTSQSLPYNIIMGYGSKITWYNKPRDFIKKTVANMKNSKSHIECMKNSLKNRLGKGTII